jgi:hypothetical protein
MKASEIITDDIVSRDKRKPAKDVVGKRVPNDYFGNRAEIKKRDRDLLSKEEFKKKQKQWFEEQELNESHSLSFDIRSDYIWPAKILESVDKLRTVEFEQWLSDQRNNQIVPDKGKTGILAMCVLMDNKIMIIYGPAKYIGQTDTDYILRIPSGTHKHKKKSQIFFNSSSALEEFITLLSLKYASSELEISLSQQSVMKTSIGEDDLESEQLDESTDRTEIIIRKNTIPQDQGFRRKLDRFFSMVDAELSNEPERISDRAVLLTVPGNKVERVIHVLTELGIDVSRAKSLAEDDPCWKNYQQVGMKKKDGREVPNCVPKANVKEVADTDQDKYNETVEEETMKQAAKNPQGARFGGYYGATQRGAPRRGQGFGS